METRRRPSIKLTGGPHGIPRAVVLEVQRGRLLDAVAEVIAEEGYLATTVDKILKRARISRRTFYEIFKDKEDCFLAAYDEAADHVVELVGQSCRESATPEQKVADGLRTMFEFAEREPNVARMCVVEVLAAGNKARDRRAQAMETLTELVAVVLTDRCVDHEEALLRARVLAGGVHEVAFDRLSRNQIDGLAELADEVVETHLAPQEAVGT